MIIEKNENITVVDACFDNLREPYNTIDLLKYRLSAAEEAIRYLKHLIWALASVVISLAVLNVVYFWRLL